MNSAAYKPESRQYQGSFLTRKMGIIHIVINKINLFLGLHLTIIPFLVEQTAPKTTPPQFVQMLHFIRAKKVQHTKY